MQLGYFSFPVHPKNKSLVKCFEEDKNAILLIDKLGFKEAFIGEHLTDQHERISSSLLFISSLIHKTKNIKTAESAKIIENIQRDVNIALINEFVQIFDKLNVSINDVLSAAETKWNFLNFRPGLVGGHCISVDPYYLTYKSKKIGYKPNLILSGRKINNLMPKFIFDKLIQSAKYKKINIKKANLLIMGTTFKENCSDFRNNLSIVVRDLFLKKGVKVDIYDPLIDRIKFERTYQYKPIVNLKNNYYDIIAILVSHKIFIKMGINSIRKFSKKNNIIFDFKNIFNNEKDIYRL